MMRSLCCLARLLPLAALAGLVAGAAASSVRTPRSASFNIQQPPAEPPRYSITAIGRAEYITKALAVNRDGTVAGIYQFDLSSDGVAFTWRDGTLRALGTLGGKHSSPNAINDHGDVAG